MMKKVKISMARGRAQLGFATALKKAILGMEGLLEKCENA